MKHGADLHCWVCFWQTDEVDWIGRQKAKVVALQEPALGVSAGFFCTTPLLRTLFSQSPRQSGGLNGEESGFREALQEILASARSAALQGCAQSGWKRDRVARRVGEWWKLVPIWAFQGVLELIRLDISDLSVFSVSLLILLFPALSTVAIHRALTTEKALTIVVESTGFPQPDHSFS